MIHDNRAWRSPTGCTIYKDNMAAMQNFSSSFALMAMINETPQKGTGNLVWRDSINIPTNYNTVITNTEGRGTIEAMSNKFILQ
jgi:hypothetical protein